MRAMPEYRFYTVKEDGHFEGAPAIVESADDQTAIQKAKQRVKKLPIEVWQLARRVASLDPKRK
jgi:hypothetical protein